MQLAACPNGVRIGCLAGSPRSCGAVRARQSSAASRSCIVVLAHTGNLACPVLPSARTDGRATVQNLPQLAYEGTEHGGQWGEGRGKDLHAAPRRQLRARWEGFEAAAHLDTTLVVPGTLVDEVLAAIRDSSARSTASQMIGISLTWRGGHFAPAPPWQQTGLRGPEKSKGPAANFVGEAD